jgi:hypothetical protein
MHASEICAREGARAQCCGAQGFFCFPIGMYMNKLTYLRCVWRMCCVNLNVYRRAYTYVLMHTLMFSYARTLHICAYIRAYTYVLIRTYAAYMRIHSRENTHRPTEQNAGLLCQAPDVKAQVPTHTPPCTIICTWKRLW